MPLTITDAERATCWMLWPSADRQEPAAGIHDGSARGCRPYRVGPARCIGPRARVLRDFWNPPPDLRQAGLGREGLGADRRSLCSDAVRTVDPRRNAALLASVPRSRGMISWPL